MDLISLAVAKNYANKVAAGFKSVELNGMNLIFTLLDDSKATVTLPAPKDGISVQNLTIDEDGSLLCHMSDGEIIDAGYVPTVDPDLTNYYTKEEIDKELKNCEAVVLTNYTDGNIAIAQKAIDAMKENKQVIIIKKPDSNSGNNSTYGPMYVCSPTLTITDDYSGTVYFKSHSFTSIGYNAYNTIKALEYLPTFYQLQITVSKGIVTSAGNIGSTTNFNNNNRVSVLGLNNMKEYTPTSDYHPATKKYVDDSIANIGTSETDLTNYYTKEEVNAAIAEAIAQALGTVEAELSTLTTPEEEAE